MGYLGVIRHRVQFSENGTYFDYRTDGGQNVLFPITRLSMDIAINNRHEFVFLYQPLRLETSALLEDDLVVDSLLFPAGTPMGFLYNFPFYRFSYLYNFADGTDRELALGLTFQIRNATINFRSLDGELYRTANDIGPVPALKFRARYPVSDYFWLGTEIDGIYAPVSYLNGSDEEIEGAIIDASLRGGIPFREKGDIFFNVRYLGGGAVGTNEDDSGPGDGYVKNWLQFITVSLGLTYNFL